MVSKLGYYIKSYNDYWTFLSDTFDENTPPIDDPKYISSLGASIFKGMQNGDSNAVWLMQVKGDFKEASIFLI